MNNAIDTAYEEERNVQFQQIAAKVIEARLRLTYLEQEMDKAYVGTTADRLEQEQYAIMGFYWNDCTSDEIKNNNNQK